MSSFRVRKTVKLVERMTELENVMKEFRKYSEEIIEICSKIVEKVKRAEDLDVFLSEYSIAYHYLSNCSASFTDFGCRMEILRNGIYTSLQSELDSKTNLQSVLGTEEETFAKSISSPESVLEQTGHDKSMCTPSDGGTNWSPKDEIIDKNDSSSKGDANSTADGKESRSATDGNHIELEEVSSPDSSRENSVRCRQMPFHRINSDSERFAGGRNRNLRNLKINLQVGTIHEVILSRMVSPDEFYVYVKCEELEMMKELEDKLSKINRKELEWGCNRLHNGYKKKNLASEILGPYALRFSEELSAWTRIKVLDWRMEESDDLILVFHVDHGFSSLVRVADTFPMSESTENYPIFIQKCYLPSLVPVEGKWSEEDKVLFEIFTESTENKCQMGIEITEVDKNRDDGAIGVNLFLPESRISINDKLVEFGIAVTRNDLFSARYLPPWSVTERIPVKVTCICKVNHLFCVKDYGRANEKDQLEHLIDLLNSPKTVLPPLENAPGVSDLVIAKYEDGLWYRAQVLKRNLASDSFSVIFLDYGNTENLSMNDMRKIEHEHLKIPFQMVECFLGEVEPNWEGDQRKGIAYLKERVAGDLTVEIRGVLDELRSVYDVTIYDNEGKNIVSDLVSGGHVVWSKKC